MQELQKSYHFSSALSLGHSFLTGKACRMQLSSGIAPNRHLLQAKHPACPPPVTPNANSEPVALSLTFNVYCPKCSLGGTIVYPGGQQKKFLPFSHRRDPQVILRILKGFKLKPYLSRPYPEKTCSVSQFGFKCSHHGCFEMDIRLLIRIHIYITVQFLSGSHRSSLKCGQCSNPYFV